MKESEVLEVFRIASSAVIGPFSVNNNKNGDVSQSPSLFIFIRSHLKAAALVSSRHRFCLKMGHNKGNEAGSVVVAD